MFLWLLMCKRNVSDRFWDCSVTATSLLLSLSHEKLSQRSELRSLTWTLRVIAFAFCLFFDKWAGDGGCKHPSIRANDQEINQSINPLRARSTCSYLHFYCHECCSTLCQRLGLDGKCKEKCETYSYGCIYEPIHSKSFHAALAIVRGRRQLSVPWRSIIKRHRVPDCARRERIL